MLSERRPKFFETPDFIPSIVQKSNRKDRLKPNPPVVPLTVGSLPPYFLESRIGRPGFKLRLGTQWHGRIGVRIVSPLRIAPRRIGFLSVPHQVPLVGVGKERHNCLVNDLYSIRAAPALTRGHV